MIRGCVLDIIDSTVFKIKRINFPSVVFSSQAREVIVAELEIRWKTERMTILKRSVTFNKRYKNVKNENKITSSVSLRPTIPRGSGCDLYFLLMC